VDSSNNLYVIDEENSRLLKFVPSKSEWSKIPISRSTYNLWDVELSYTGDIFLLGKGVLERCGSSSGICEVLKKCYAEAITGGRNEYLCYMTAFVLDSKGNVFYTEHDYNQVNKYDFSIEKVINICDGFKHKGVDCFGARAIAIDASDNLYISTSGSSIYKFNTSTLKWSLIADPGKELGQVNNPHGLDIDSSGNVYVLDLGNGRVQKFIKDTTKWMEIKYPETGLRSFRDCPGNLAVDSSGVIYVSDFCGDKVLKFTPSK
jgi:streptogramin lyase